jgi:hypothetical protein
MQFSGKSGGDPNGSRETGEVESQCETRGGFGFNHAAVSNLNGIL